MVDTGKGRRWEGKKPPDPHNLRDFERWLAQQPPEWSVVIAVRAALRVLPLAGVEQSSTIVLSIFRATAIARFAAKYSNRANGLEALRAGGAAAGASAASASAVASGVAYAAAAAAYAVASTVGDFATSTSTSTSTSAVAHAAAASDYAASAVRMDVDSLASRAMTPQQLAEAELWFAFRRSPFAAEWQSMKSALLGQGGHWSVWIDWYESVLSGTPSRSEDEDAAFTEVAGKLSWDNAEAANTEISQRLRAIRARPGSELPNEARDPDPLENIPSPISIERRADGRIGVDAAQCARPTLPPAFDPADHERLLAACRARADQLRDQLTSRKFQVRSDYAELLAEYLQWLPAEPGSGNILLADGEARILNKLFAAEQDELPVAFSGRLSTLLEDHQGLRPYYPELERHYRSIATGRLATPLPHDAVEGIRRTIHEHSPEVFDDTVAPVMDETARPVPSVGTPLPEDVPPPDPNRPKPLRDPIADVDPAASRGYTFASAANRIFKILKRGKDVGDGVKGWNEAYAAFKENIPHLLQWLRDNWPGGIGGDGGPTLPPTIGV